MFLDSLMTVPVTQGAFSTGTCQDMGKKVFFYSKSSLRTIPETLWKYSNTAYPEPPLQVGGDLCGRAFNRVNSPFQYNSKEPSSFFSGLFQEDRLSLMTKQC